jgi:hypothetical protein
VIFSDSCSEIATHSYLITTKTFILGFRLRRGANAGEETKVHLARAAIRNSDCHAWELSVATIDADVNVIFAIVMENCSELAPMNF